MVSDKMLTVAITTCLVIGLPLVSSDPGAAQVPEAQVPEAHVPEAPVAVSPGDASTRALVEDRCPTFSWGTIEGARSYELVVYRLGEEGEEEEKEPVVRENLAGSASLWTPSLDACLERGGRYAWSIRAEFETGSSDWSTSSLFQIAAAPSLAQLEQALAVVREYLDERDDAGLPNTPPVGARSPAVAGVGEKDVDRSAQAITGPVSDASVLPVGDLDCRAGRYEDNGDGTVSDCRTGLIWLKDASCFQLEQWAGAQSLVAGLFDGSTNDPNSGDCGLTDGSAAGFWRLATANEWKEMLTSARLQGFTTPALTDAQGRSEWTTDGDVFVGVKTSGAYWTNTEASPTLTWFVDLGLGGLGAGLKLSIKEVWPVRAEQ
jgi:hypothetical protein